MSASQRPSSCSPCRPHGELHGLSSAKPFTVSTQRAVSKHRDKASIATPESRSEVPAGPIQQHAILPRHIEQRISKLYSTGLQEADLPNPSTGGDSHRSQGKDLTDSPEQRGTEQSQCSSGCAPGTEAAAPTAVLPQLCAPLPPPLSSQSPTGRALAPKTDGNSLTAARRWD